MAYTYHDWQQQTTPSTRLSRLRLHLAEVSLAITAAVSANGSSRSASDLRQYWADLSAMEQQIMDQYGTDGTGNPTVGVFRLGRVSE